MKFWMIDQNGEIRQTSVSDPDAVHARNRTDARTKFLQFAHRVLRDPPRLLRVTPRAWQMHIPALSGNEVAAGTTDRAFPMCIASSEEMPRPADIPAEFAGFSSYDGEEREERTHYPTACHYPHGVREGEFIQHPEHGRARIESVSRRERIAACTVEKDGSSITIHLEGKP